LCVEVDDGAAAVVGVLAAVDQLVARQVDRELARRGERQAQLPRDLSDRARALRRHVHQHREVARAERRVAGEVALELDGEAAPPPQPPQDVAQQPAELVQLRRCRPRTVYRGNMRPPITVIMW